MFVWFLVGFCLLALFCCLAYLIFAITRLVREYKEMKKLW